MKSKLGIFIAIMLLMSIVSWGQETREDNQNPCPHKKQHHFMGERHHGPKIPDLTEEQEEQIKSLHLELGQEALPIKNELKEKEARLHSLKTAAKIDMDAINTQIEAIGLIKIDLAKKHAKLEQDIRKLLNEEQRLHFDMHLGQHNDFRKPAMKMKKKRFMHKY